MVRFSSYHFDKPVFIAVFCPFSFALVRGNP
nr:MAG TPA: hypothetical protein [Caudoviricetes sp.]